LTESQGCAIKEIRPPDILANAGGNTSLAE